MPQLALAAVGYVIGGAFGYAALGMTVGSVVGGLLAQPSGQHSEGPRLSDLKAPAVTYGSVIPYIEGHPRLGGSIIWASTKREIAHTTEVGGKGGGGSDVTNFTYEQDILFELSANVCWSTLRRVWLNGELVFTQANDSDGASVATSVSDQAKYWSRITLYDGNASQLPDPTYEAVVGVGNAPAYRDRCTIMVEGLKLGTSGQIPVLTFEGTSAGLVDTGVRDTSAVGWYISQAYDSETGPPFPSEWGGGPDDDNPAPFPYHWGPGAWSPPTPFQFTGPHDYPGTPFPYPLTPPPGGNSALNEKFPGGLLVLSGDTFPTWSFNTVQLVDGHPIQRAEQLFATDVFGIIGTGLHLVSVFIYYDDGKVLTVALGEPTLEDVIKRQCARGGISSANVDASDCASISVRALAITQATSPRQVIEMLMAAYNLTFVETDKLVFKRRGTTPEAFIDYSELIAAEDGDPLPIRKASDIELPSMVAVKYSNVDDDYQDGLETSDRLLSSGNSVAQIELPLGLTPTEAKRIADFQVMDAVASSLQVGPFSVDRTYAYITPGDVVSVTARNGAEYMVRIEKLTQSGGVLTFTGRSDSPDIVNSSAVTSGDYTNSTGVTLPLDTVLKLADIPLLADVDDGAGFYAAVKGATAGAYAGAVLFKSTDTVTLESITTMPSAAVFGVTTTTLASGPVGVFDEGTSVTVNVGLGVLSSLTRDALLASKTANRILIGSEVIQFRDATLVSAGVYKLTGLLRGQQGTDWARGSHATGETVILLNSAVRRIPMTNAEIGISKFWRGVTIGRTTTTAVDQAFVDTAVGLKPYSPVDVRFARDASGNLTVTWQRRSRLSSRLIGSLGMSCPLGEASEAYQVEFYTSSAFTTLARPAFTVTSPTASYSAANQTTDLGAPASTNYVKVYQMSATVGRGYAATAQG